MIVLSLRHISLEFLRANWLLVVVLTIFFLAGITFGSLGARHINQGLKDDLSQNINKFYSKVPDAGITGKEIIKGSLTKNLYVIIGMYILGLSVVGSVLVPIIVFTRGFTLGFTIGFLVGDQAWKGILMSIVSILPQNLLFIPVMLLSALMTLSFSLHFLKGRLVFREFEMGRSIAFYTVGMVGAVMLTGAGCVLESYVTPTLMKYSAAFLF